MAEWGPKGNFQCLHEEEEKEERGGNGASEPGL